MLSGVRTTDSPLTGVAISRLTALTSWWAVLPAAASHFAVAGLPVPRASFVSRERAAVLAALDEAGL